MTAVSSAQILACEECTSFSKSLCYSLKGWDLNKILEAPRMGLFLALILHHLKSKHCSLFAK